MTYLTALATVLMAGLFVGADSKLTYDFFVERTKWVLLILLLMLIVAVTKYVIAYVG